MPLSLSVLGTLHKMVARINSAKQEFLRFWMVPVDHNQCGHEVQAPNYTHVWEEEQKEDDLTYDLMDGAY